MGAPVAAAAAADWLLDSVFDWLVLDALAFADQWEADAEADFSNARGWGKGEKRDPVELLSSSGLACLLQRRVSDLGFWVKELGYMI